jgi:GldL N-terminal domain
MSLEIKILKTPLRISIAIIFIGVMFKIMHWPYRDWIMTTGFSLVAILYPFRFFKKEQKKILDYAKLFFVVSWAIYGIFSILHLPYKMGFEIARSVSFIFWIVMEGVNYLTKRERKEYRVLHIVSYVLVSISAALIFIGALFKIMHWPGAGPMLVVGLSLAVVWFLLDFIKK